MAKKKKAATKTSAKKTTRKVMSETGGISAEVDAILGGVEDDFEDAIERANPVPANGLYAMVMTKYGARRFQPKDKQKGEATIVRLSFKVVSDGDYEDYTFGNDFFSLSFPDVASFCNAQADGEVVKPNEISHYLNQACEEGTVFHVEITRNKSTDGKKEYVDIRAHRKMEVVGDDD